MATRELEILLTLKDQASQSLSNFNKNLNAIKPAFTQMAAVGTLAFGAISAVAVSSLKEFSDAEKQATIANQALTNTLANMSGDALHSLTSQLGGTTDALSGL